MGPHASAQICINGHLVTESLEINPGLKQDFCGMCGAATITQCQHCSASIRGAFDYPGTTYPYDQPSYCHACGKPYPWTEGKIKAAVEMFIEFGELNEEEKATIKEDIENIARDTPRTELSANRIKRIWKRSTAIGYDLILEFASRTAANILKAP